MYHCPCVSAHASCEQISHQYCIEMVRGGGGGGGRGDAHAVLNLYSVQVVRIQILLINRRIPDDHALIVVVFPGPHCMQTINLPTGMQHNS